MNSEDAGLRLRKNITQTGPEAVPDATAEQIAKQDVKQDDRLDTANMTALQKHSAFFDRNQDGKISLGDTYRGFRAIGFNLFTSALFAWILNAGLAWPTSPGWLPTTTIHLKNIHRSNHGSDTGSYDEDGNLVEKKFSDMFDRWDSDKDGYWTWGDAWRRMRDQRDVFDFFGQFASFLEFGVTFWVAAENGKLSKDVLHGIYDGTFFYQLEQRQIDAREAKKAQKEAKRHAKQNLKNAVRAGPSH